MEHLELKFYPDIFDEKVLRKSAQWYAKLDKLVQRLEADEKVIGLSNMIEQMENQAAALEWKKELEEKKLAQMKKKRMAPVLKQIKDKLPKLKSVDKGAQEWAQELQQKERVEKIRRSFLPVFKKLKSLQLGKKIADKQKEHKKIHDIKAKLEKIHSQILKHKGEFPLKATGANKKAIEWGKTIDSVNQKCKTWDKSSKTTNPFNKTNKGRKLVVGGKTSKVINAFCKDPKKACSSKPLTYKKFCDQL